MLPVNVIYIYGCANEEERRGQIYALHMAVNVPVGLVTAHSTIRFTSEERFAITAANLWQLQ